MGSIGLKTNIYRKLPFAISTRPPSELLFETFFHPIVNNKRIALGAKICGILSGFLLTFIFIFYEIFRRLGRVDIGDGCAARKDYAKEKKDANFRHLFLRFSRIFIISYVFNAVFGMISTATTRAKPNQFIIFKIKSIPHAIIPPSFINMAVNYLFGPIRRRTIYCINLFFSHSKMNNIENLLIIRSMYCCATA